MTNDNSSRIGLQKLYSQRMQAWEEARAIAQRAADRPQHHQMMTDTEEAAYQAAVNRLQRLDTEMRQLQNSESPAAPPTRTPVTPLEALDKLHQMRWRSTMPTPPGQILRDLDRQRELERQRRHGEQIKQDIEDQDDSHRRRDWQRALEYEQERSAEIATEIAVAEQAERRRAVLATQRRMGELNAKLIAAKAET